MACFEATSHAVWMHNFFGDLGIVNSTDRPMRMYCDNSATVSFSNNLKELQVARYINMKFYKVKKKDAEGLIAIEHTPTYNMMIDLSTKAFPVGIFEEHVSRMRLWSS